MADPQVLIEGKDIYALGLVRDIPKLSEKKTYRRDKLTINQISLTVDNGGDFFSVDNPQSQFSNTYWRYNSLIIINADGETIWDGIVKDIKRDQETKIATIISVDKLYQFYRNRLSYDSGASFETPAEAFKNICDQEGFLDYNEKSVNDSIAQQTGNCAIKCHFDYSITFRDALELLGEVGVADVYSSKNEVYYKHWQAFSGGIKVNLTESDLLRAPLIWSSEKDMVNDYKIGYFGDNEVFAIDSANDNKGNISRDKYGTQSSAEFNCSNNQQIEIENLASAKYIGNTYIERTHIDVDTRPRPPQIIKFVLPLDHKDWVDLQTFFSLTLSDEGWNQKVFEIFEAVIDENRQQIPIKAYEVSVA